MAKERGQGTGLRLGAVTLGELENERKEGWMKGTVNCCTLGRLGSNHKGSLGGGEAVRREGRERYSKGD